MCTYILYVCIYVYVLHSPQNPPLSLDSRLLRMILPQQGISPSGMFPSASSQSLSDLMALQRDTLSRNVSRDNLVFFSGKNTGLPPPSSLSFSLFLSRSLSLSRALSLSFWCSFQMSLSLSHRLLSHLLLSRTFQHPALFIYIYLIY